MEEKQLEDQAIQKREEKREKFKKEAEYRRKAANEAARVEFNGN